jgi:hypothetical protein
MTLPTGRGPALRRALRNFRLNLRRRRGLARRRAPAPARPNPSPPRIEFSYTIYWTKQVRRWDAGRRAAAQQALRQALAQPGFEANDYERRYRVPEIDDAAHAGASLTALAKVLQAFEQEAA